MKREREKYVERESNTYKDVHWQREREIRRREIKDSERKRR